VGAREHGGARWPGGEAPAILLHHACIPGALVVHREPYRVCPREFECQTRKGRCSRQSLLAAAAIGAALPEASSAGSVRLQGRNVSQSLRM
jgi:hypothetical protein